MLLLQRALITYAHYSQLHHCDQLIANTFPKYLFQNCTGSTPELPHHQIFFQPHKTQIVYFGHHKTIQNGKE